MSTPVQRPKWQGYSDDVCVISTQYVIILQIFGGISVLSFTRVCHFEKLLVDGMSRGPSLKVEERGFCQEKDKLLPKYMFTHTFNSTLCKERKGVRRRLMRCR